MKKKFRIKKNEEFQKIIYKRHSTANKSFILYYDIKKEEKARVGISVSKKMGNAVVRNKIKRQIRMMVDDIFSYNSADYDIIVIVRPNYSKQKYQINKKDLEYSFKHAKMKR